MRRNMVDGLNVELKNGADNRFTDLDEIDKASSLPDVKGRRGRKKVLQEGNAESSKNDALPVEKDVEANEPNDEGVGNNWVADLRGEEKDVCSIQATEWSVQKDRDCEKDQEGRERFVEGLNFMVMQEHGGKGSSTDPSVQPMGLSELGANPCSTEERKKRLTKYLTKRQGRSSSGRPPKPSTSHTHAERRSKRIEKHNLRKDEEMGATDQQCLGQLKEDELMEGEPDPPTDVVAGPGGEPVVGMLFLNGEKAFEFYAHYAATMGFNVRKGSCDRTGRNVSKSKIYVCSKEGCRPKNMKPEPNNSRSDVRTGCQAHMTIKITVSGRFVVTDFEKEHNHELKARIENIQIIMADKVLPMVQLPALSKVSMIPDDYKNYLRSKRAMNIKLDDAKGICEYLQKMKGRDPSFFYSIQVDEDDQLVNVLWSDFKSMIDYHYFGDVMCLDTRYGTGSCGRPLALFIGVNHHKLPVIFGAAFLYDRSPESLKWLFQTFQSAMCGKQPKVLFTSNDTPTSDAVAGVWAGTTHRLSSFHIYQDAVKELSTIFERSEYFAADLSKCLYDIDEEIEFLSAWDLLTEKYNLKSDDWLARLYACRDKWALPYGRETFNAYIMSALRLDNLDIFLKDHLMLDTNLSDVFQQYDRYIEEKRLAERQADYFANQIPLRVAPLGLLWQAFNLYTPAMFEVFRLEFELFLTSIVYSVGEVGTLSEFEVTAKDQPRGHVVRFDSSECIAVCSCKRFDSVGIPCCHILKVLDIKNIKELPPRYILRRWTKEAKTEPLSGSCSLGPDNDVRSALLNRYNYLCRTLYRTVMMAVENTQAYAFLERQSEQMLERVEQMLHMRPHDKSLTNATSRDLQCASAQNKVNTNNDYRKVGSKKSKNGDSRKRNESPLESNKGKKAKQALVIEEAEAQNFCLDESTVSCDVQSHFRTAPNQQFLPPSQLIQAPYVPVPHFGLGSFQVFHGLPQFSQIQEHSTPLQQSLQQPPSQPSHFHSSHQLVQAPHPDIQALQFMACTPQLGQQNADQGHYTVPVWDFL